MPTLGSDAHLRQPVTRERTDVVFVPTAVVVEDSEDPMVQELRAGLGEIRRLREELSRRRGRWWHRWGKKTTTKN